MIRNNDKPADFSAVNSFFSERFPNVIIDENRTAKGKASGINVAET